MKKTVLLSAILVGLVGCGDGSSGGGTVTAPKKDTPLTRVNFEAEYQAKLAAVNAVQSSDTSNYSSPGNTFLNHARADNSYTGYCLSTNMVVETDNFIVGRHDNSTPDSELVETAKMIESAWGDVLDAFDLKQSDLPNIGGKYLACHYPTSGESGGNAYLTSFKVDFENEDTPMDAYQVTMHELTHMLQFQLTGTAVGERWFTEGLASIVGQKKFSLGDRMTTFMSEECFDTSPTEILSWNDVHPEHSGGDAYSTECMETEYGTYSSLLRYLDDEYNLDVAAVLNAFAKVKSDGLTLRPALNAVLLEKNPSKPLAIDNIDKGFVTEKVIPWTATQADKAKLITDKTIDGVFIATGDYINGDIDGVDVNSDDILAFLKHTRNGLYDLYFIAASDADAVYGPIEIGVRDNKIDGGVVDLTDASLCHDDNC